MWTKIKLANILAAVLLAVSGCSVFNKGGSEAEEPVETPKVIVRTASRSSKPTPAPEYVNNKRVINFAGVSDGTNAMARLIAAYNEQCDDAYVKFNELPANYMQRYKKLNAMLETGGVDYDVFETDITFTAEYAEKNYVLSLDGYAHRSGINMDLYLPSAVSAATYKEGLWGMPCNVSVNLLYVRNDLIKAIPKTWEDLASYAASLNGKGGTKYGLLASGEPSENLVSMAMELIYAYGGEVFDAEGKVAINSAAAAKGMDTLAGIFKSSYVPSNIGKLSAADTISSFVNGEGVYMIAPPYAWSLGNSASSKVRERFSIAKLPAGGGESSVLDATVMMINASTRYPEQAWDFIRFAASYEGQKILAVNGGRVPAMPSVMDDADVRFANPHFYAEGFKSIILNADPKPVLPHYAELSAIMQDELYRLFTTTQTSKDAVASIETRMNVVIRNNR